jgi:hypothetical protein
MPRLRRCQVRRGEGTRVARRDAPYIGPTDCEEIADVGLQIRGSEGRQLQRRIAISATLIVALNGQFRGG